MFGNLIKKEIKMEFDSYVISETKTATSFPFVYPYNSKCLSRFKFQKAAFTLAETLITLAIIGVIAAMTVPTIQQKYHKQVIETRLKKFYSTMNQAIQLSELDNGEKESWEAKNVDEFWNKYLKNYLRYEKTDDSCIQSNGYKRKIVYFSDGSLVSFGHSPEYQGQHYSFFPFSNQFICDASADSTKKNIVNSWVFIFMAKPEYFGNNAKYHTGKGLEPYRIWWDGNPNHLYSWQALGCNPNEGKHYCAAIIQDNNWVIPDNFPLKY